MALAACGSIVKVPSAFEEVWQVSNEYMWPAVTMQILTSLSCLLQFQIFGHVRLFRAKPQPIQDLPLSQRVCRGGIDYWCLDAFLFTPGPFPIFLPTITTATPSSLLLSRTSTKSRNPLATILSCVQSRSIL